LQQYKLLLKELDKSCAKAQKLIPKIPCKLGCSDCCKQLFPLSMIEAFYINKGFKLLDRNTRRELASKAKKAQEKLQKLNLKQFETTSLNLEDIALNRNEFTRILQSTKQICPLLSDKNLCLLYPYRNHDCRIHGVSFDPSTNEIIGCSRHSKIFTNPGLKNKFVKNAVENGYLYKEKSKLDSLLVKLLADSPPNNEKLAYCYYFTTPFVPLLKDYAEVDWGKFFGTESETAKMPWQKSYSMVIDCEY